MKTTGTPPTHPHMPPKDSKKKLNDNNLAEVLKKMHHDTEEVAVRMEQQRVHQTIVFFGSAQIVPYEKAKERLSVAQKAFDESPEKTDELWRKLGKANNAVAMSRYYAEAEELSYRLSKWTQKEEDIEKQYVICSGGGPGIMEAANKGAHRAEARSIGLSIDIPLEQSPNNYITKELDFKFNYFLLRKFWFFYYIKALVIFPGGLGTLDEVFEILTRVKTKKTEPLPIVLFGSSYWKEVINFQPMITFGTISPEDVDLFYFCDSVDCAFNYITKGLPL